MNAVDPRHYPLGTGVGLIGARTEPVSCAGQHDHPDVVVDAQLVDRVAQRKHHIERHRVHPLGTVQRDLRDMRTWAIDEDERHRPNMVGRAASQRTERANRG